MDLRPRSGSAQTQSASRLRPVGHAFLPERLRLRRGDPLSVDNERLLADGRHRVRHREAAARAGSRQYPRPGHADFSRSLGAHPEEDAEEGAWQGKVAGPTGSTGGAADGSGSPLRAL